MGKRYIQTASDKNVEGVEFYVKNVSLIMEKIL